MQSIAKFDTVTNAEEVGEPYGSGSSVTRLYLKSDTFDFRYRHNNV
jgi:hypothetical protein